jgi:hypothetical protein
MKKKLLLVLAMIALLVAVLIPASQAQGYNAYAVQTLVSGGTNTVAVSTASTAYASTVMNLSRQREVPILISVKSDRTNDLTMTFHFDVSVDGSTWFTNHTSPYSVSVAANGTTAVVVATNVVNGGFGYMRLGYVNNLNGTAVLTNLNVQYGIKR